MPLAATWMDPEMITLSEESQRKKYRVMRNLKYGTNELTSKQKQTHRHRKQTYGWLPKGKRGRVKLAWDQQVQTIYIK